MLFGCFVLDICFRRYYFCYRCRCYGDDFLPRRIACFSQIVIYISPYVKYIGETLTSGLYFLTIFTMTFPVSCYTVSNCKWLLGNDISKLFACTWVSGVMLKPTGTCFVYNYYANFCNIPIVLLLCNFKHHATSPAR